MLKNYFKIALRTLLKNKTFSFINIFGLGVGLSVCMLITLILHNLGSYDQFHPEGDRLYRVISDRSGRSPSSFSTAPLPLYESLVNDFPGLEKGVRIKKDFGGDLRYGSKILPMQGLFTEPVFFDLFGFKLKYGNPRLCLEAPYALVMTEASAAKFGLKGEEAIGKTLTVGELGDFTLTGILEEPPVKTHMKFELLASMASMLPLEKEGKIRSDLEDWAYTDDAFLYFRLSPQQDPRELEALFSPISDQHYEAYDNYRLDFRLQAMADITPAKGLENDMSFTLPQVILYFLGALALLVILTAGFNYTNLSIARSLTRAREIGIRKVVGASRSQIFAQFVSEAVILALLAMATAWAILEILLIPGFESLSINQFITIDLSSDLALYGKFIVLALAVGIGAGAFPAWFLSRFEPLQVLQKLSGVKLSTRQGMRKALIVFQFALSLFLIISVSLMFHQTRYMLQADYGFNQEQVINVSLQGNDYEVVRTEMGSHPDIMEISGISTIPATGSNSAGSLRLPGDTEDRVWHQLFVDHRYLDNLELELLKGRAFDASTAGNGEREPFVLLNEAAVKAWGFEHAGEVIGQAFTLGSDEQTTQVIGVVKDFHYRELSSPIGPLMIRHRPDALRYANLKVASQDLPATMAFIEDTWQEIDPVHAVEYDFFAAQIGDFISIFADGVSIIGFISILAAIIACLGLLGISAYQAEVRLREIGIRKVLGASIRSIVVLLSKGFLALLLLAILLAVPAAWLINGLWLDTYSFHVEWQAWHFLLGISLLLGLGFMTIGSQALRAAIANPVDSLKDE